MKQQIGGDADALADAQVLDRTQELLRLQREVEVGLTAMVAQIDQRGLAQTYGCKNTVQFLRQAFRFTASEEAAATLRLAAAVSPRRSMTGQVLAPAHPQTAEAFTAGRVSAGCGDRDPHRGPAARLRARRGASGGGEGAARPCRDP